MEESAIVAKTIGRIKLLTSIIIITILIGPLINYNQNINPFTLLQNKMCWH